MAATGSFTFGPLYVPYGRQDRVSVYVKDSSLGERDFSGNMVAYNFSYVKNQIAVGEVTLLGISAAEQAHFDVGNAVKVFIGNSLFYKFRIASAKFDSVRTAYLTLEGMECKAKYSYTDRSTFVYDDTASNTVTNNLISGLFSAGSIANLGKVFFRAEYDTKLAALMNQARYHMADWWMSWNQSESYDTDYYNIAQTKGTGVSKYAFVSSGSAQNIFMSTNNSDVRNIANYVICMGSGDGTTQLVSVNFHATTNRTYLNGGDTWLDGVHAAAGNLIVDSTSGFPSSGTVQIGKEQVTYTGITATSFTGCTRGASGTTASVHFDNDEVINLTTLIVDSTTSLPASGNVWIGSEKVSYSAKPSSTTLTIASRGASSTPVYAHSDNIEVYDAQYTSVAPQSGSSISDNGVYERRYDFYDVINRNTLDLIAQMIAAELKTLKKSISVIPIDMFPLFTIPLSLGDTVTVTDAVSGLDDSYEIVSFKLSKAMGSGDRLVMGLSQVSTDYIAQVAETRKELGNMGSYAQGSVIPLQDSDSDNCGTGYGLELNVFIPAETIGIKNLKLAYNVDSYRAFSSTTAANPGSSIIVDNSAEGTTQVIGTSATSVTAAAITPASVGEMTVVYLTVKLQDTLQTLANQEIGFRVMMSKTGETTRYYPSSSSTGTEMITGGRTDHRHAGGSHTHAGSSKFIEVSENVAAAGQCSNTNTVSSHYHEPVDTSDEFVVVASGYSIINASSTEAAGTENTGYSAELRYGIATVIIPGDTNGWTLTPQLKSYYSEESTCDVVMRAQVISAHTHDVTFGISETASAASDIAIEVDGVDKTSDIETALGYTLSTSLGQEIDLYSILPSSFKSGSWHNITIKPTGNCWIQGHIFGMIFVST